MKNTWLFMLSIVIGCTCTVNARLGETVAEIEARLWETFKRRRNGLYRGKRSELRER